MPRPVERSAARSRRKRRAGGTSALSTLGIGIATVARSWVSIAECEPPTLWRAWLQFLAVTKHQRRPVGAGAKQSFDTRRSQAELGNERKLWRVQLRTHCREISRDHEQCGLNGAAK